MVLVTDWNLRSNEDSRAPAEEADEEEALPLPPPPPAAIFPVCTSAAAPPAAAAAGAARRERARAWAGGHCECVKPEAGRAAGGGQGARARLLRRPRRRLLHAAGRGRGAPRFNQNCSKWLCLNQLVTTGGFTQKRQVLRSLSKSARPRHKWLFYASALHTPRPLPTSKPQTPVRTAVSIFSGILPDCPSVAATFHSLRSSKHRKGPRLSSQNFFSFFFFLQRNSKGTAAVSRTRLLTPPPGFLLNLET